ncbi:MAG: glycosyltransferase family 4 protein [Deltaproteobacteria bacterium]|nr:MAG: glycosyltransferase family 4 protein [Deltaproteobacteria bacterium]
MRVLFWSEHFWPYMGGAEVWGLRLVLALRDRGYEFFVVTSHDYLELADEAQYNGITIYRFPFRPALARGNIEQFIEVRQRVARLKRALAPDLVHIHIIGPSVLFHLQTAKAHPAPVSVTMRQEIVTGEVVDGDSIQGQILRAADWVVGCSAAILDQGRRWAPEIIPHSSVIYNAPEAPPDVPEPLSTDPPRLLCVGRLVSYKGVDVAVAAFKSIIDRFPLARLIIAGDGPARPQLERQAIELGLKDAVKFLGWVTSEQVPNLINSATAVIIPSWREGLPWVALEAALMARPVVATSVGGLPEVIVHQQTGLLVEPGNSGAIAAAILSLLEHPERARQMGENARRRAQTVFSWARYVDAYDDLYGELIQRCRCSRPALSR